MSAIVGEGGPGLHSDVFRQSGPFTVLPHSVASLYSGNAQAVPTTTWTDLVADAASGATWSRGSIRIEPSTGKIYVDGLTRDTVIDITVAVIWDSDVPSGTKLQIKWVADDGSEALLTEGMNPFAEFHRMEISHVRSLPSAETWYKVQVAQYQGVNAYDVVGFLFAVKQIR